MARLAVGALFFIAGALKVAHPDDLASVITAMQLGLPGPIVAFIALALPSFEMLLGVYLIGGWLLPWTSLAASGLLLAFILGLSSVVLRGITTPCGCFGPGETDPTTWWTVVRDGAATVPALYLVWWSRLKPPGSG